MNSVSARQDASEGIKDRRTFQKWVCCRQHTRNLGADGSAAHSRVYPRARSRSRHQTCSCTPEFPNISFVRTVVILFMLKVVKNKLFQRAGM